MRRARGKVSRASSPLSAETLKYLLQVVFSSSIAYVPQSAWIMNASLRENIVFGRQEDEAKFVFVAT